VEILLSSQTESQLAVAGSDEKAFPEKASERHQFNLRRQLLDSQSTSSNR
jgi:hypothetical protein